MFGLAPLIQLSAQYNPGYCFSVQTSLYHQKYEIYHLYCTIRAALPDKKGVSIKTFSSAPLE